jgi:hypothetical protein
MSIENDWIFLQVAVPGLQDYILSKDLFRPLLLPSRAPREAQIPQLTIGSLLLGQARLSALNLDPARQSELCGYRQAITRVRDEWRSNWSRKARQEHPSRLRQWSQYLHDLRGDPRAYVSSFPNKIRQRAILRILQPELLEGLPQNEADQVSLLDGVLHGLAQPGPFVWETEVEPAFPRDDFWFLFLQIIK